MPVIRLDITDDEEFVCCQDCESPSTARLVAYNNTSLSNTASVSSPRTQTLLKYHHLNCEKCGLYVEIHPKSASEEGLIFVCPADIPHRHCLCYECGLLYGLEPNHKKLDMLSQFQIDNKSTNPLSAEIEPDVSSSNVLNDGSQQFNTLQIVSNSTLLFNELANSNAADHHDHDNEHDTANGGMRDEDSITLIMGTLMALIVWLTLSVCSPQLFRITACFVWLSIFCLLKTLYFDHDQSIQHAVFCLLGCSPIILALYLHERSKQWHASYPQFKDIHSTVQFCCVFGCALYFALVFSPLDMYLFVVDELLALSMTEQFVSVFLAVSLSAFVVLLANHCKFILATFCCRRYNLSKWLRVVDTDEQHQEFAVDTVAAKQVQSAEAVQPKKKRRRRRRAKNNKKTN